MAYTSIDDPTLHFATTVWSGNGNNNRDIVVDGTGMRPDWLWLKVRSHTGWNYIFDSVRGSALAIHSNVNNAESNQSYVLTDPYYNSNGFRVGVDADVNGSGRTYVGWTWAAAGSAPVITYSVKVVSDSGNKYRFDDFGTSAVTLDLQEGGTYTFDQSDSSNSGHPLRFSTTANGSHGGGSEYTTGVTTTGTPGNAGAKTVITVASGAATLYYYCTQHSAMGGQANTNSLFGSSNFGGSIQSTVSANTTAGFSIVSYTSTGSNATVGHGLGAVPSMIIFKRRSGDTENSPVYHKSLGATKNIKLNLTDVVSTSSTRFNDTEPTSSVFSLGTSGDTNGGTSPFIAYCFAEKKGYSKFSSYIGNGSSDGSYIHLGFKPSFIIRKRIAGEAGLWHIVDNKREGFNGSGSNDVLFANSNGAETDADRIDLLSNGFKVRTTDGDVNGSGAEYLYWAFSENPFVNSNGLPVNSK